MNALIIINLFVAIPLLIIGLLFLAGEIILDIIEKANQKKE